MAAVRGKGEPRAASGDGALPRGHSAGPWGRRANWHGAGRWWSVRVAFLACNLPRRFSWARGERMCVGRAGKPRFLCTFILPSPIFSRCSSGSPVYFHQPDPAVFFVSKRERLFLLLETLLGKGVHCCNLCRSRSGFQEGEGIWRTPPVPDLS